MTDTPIKICGCQLPWTDEEGRYDKFLCTKDFKECDKNCRLHRTVLDEWIQQAMNRLDEGL